MASTVGHRPNNQQHPVDRFKTARIADKDEQVAVFLEAQPGARIESGPSGRQSGADLFESASATESLREILHRLRHYGIAGEHCVYAGLVFVHRFLQARQCLLNQANTRPLLVVAVMLASKFLDDVTYNSATFASLAGIPLQTLNALEIDMLQALDFNCCVGAHHVNSVEGHIRALFE